jgi:hypothetical protein
LRNCEAMRCANDDEVHGDRDRDCDGVCELRRKLSVVGTMRRKIGRIAPQLGRKNRKKKERAPNKRFQRL